MTAAIGIRVDMPHYAFVDIIKQFDGIISLRSASGVEVVSEAWAVQPVQRNGVQLGGREEVSRDAFIEVSKLGHSSSVLVGIGRVEMVADGGVIGPEKGDSIGTISTSALDNVLAIGVSERPVSRGRLNSRWEWQPHLSERQAQ